MFKGVHQFIDLKGIITHLLILLVISASVNLDRPRLVMPKMQLLDVRPVEFQIIWNFDMEIIIFEILSYL